MTIEGTIQPDILTRMREVIYDWLERYRHRPIGIALGPEEFLNWENACRSNFRMVYDQVDKCEFEGVQIFTAPINGIVPLGGYKQISEMVDCKRRRLEGLN